MTDLSFATERVARAIRNEGPYPAFHRRVAQRHRSEWPRLWSALDDLLRALDSAEPTDHWTAAERLQNQLAAAVVPEAGVWGWAADPITEDGIFERVERLEEGYPGLG